jgi:RND superfamily putative drug exporter
MHPLELEFPVTFPTAHVARRRNAFLVLGLVVLLVGAIFSRPAPAAVAPLVSSGLPTSYQSAEVELRQKSLPSDGVAPAIVVYSSTDGAALTAEDKTAITARAAALAPLAVGGKTAPPTYSPDGKVAVVAVPVDVSVDEKVGPKVTEIRTVAAADLPEGLQAQVTGGPAIITDLTKVFEGADSTLLIATASIVALLLLITYRSPWLWLVPLTVVGIAEQMTTKLVALLAPHLGIVIDPAAAGITSVLVFGAATDYALLLIARYRDRLRQEDSRFHAMQVALRRTSEAIIASALTVTFSLLTLLLAQQESLRAIGFSAAVGVLVAMVFGLFVLPAAMVVFGRGLFWPFVPRVGDAPREGRFWGRVGEAVRRRPNLVGASATALLVVMALGGIGVQVGLSQNEQFRVKPEAVLGQETLSSAFPAGASAPAAVITNPASVTAVVAAAKTVDGVVSATPGAASADVAQIDVVLSGEPGSEESYDQIRALRDAVGAVPGADAIVGGDVAQRLDSKEASIRDAKVVIPIVLILVALVLVVLLRSVTAAALLVATVLGTFFAALGVSWFVFDHVLHYPALDNQVLLLSFLFLVALGVDYNIFLATRAREEAMVSDTREGMLTALRATGGVITSAGILLAAVFAVLGVLPLIALAQVGIIVCVGVLLDTLLVRTVLVPALAFILGERFWWPSKVDGIGHADAEGHVTKDEVPV